MALGEIGNRIAAVTIATAVPTALHAQETLPGLSTTGTPNTLVTVNCADFTQQEVDKILGPVTSVVIDGITLTAEQIEDICNQSPDSDNDIVDDLLSGENSIYDGVLPETQNVQ